MYCNLNIYSLSFDYILYNPLLQLVLDNQILKQPYCIAFSPRQIWFQKIVCKIFIYCILNIYALSFDYSFV